MYKKPHNKNKKYETSITNLNELQNEAKKVYHTQKKKKKGLKIYSSKFISSYNR
jgi:hypothetical protein